MLFAGKKWRQINCCICFKIALNPCTHLNEGCFIYFNYDTFRYLCKNSVLRKFRETGCNIVSYAKVKSISNVTGNRWAKA